VAQTKLMYYEKVYVKIIAEFARFGGLTPKIIVWDNDEKFNVDCVKDVSRAPCKSGGVLPERYTVTVLGQLKYLYYEKDKRRWFVEREIV